MKEIRELIFKILGVKVGECFNIKLATSDEVIKEEYWINSDLNIMHKNGYYSTLTFLGLLKGSWEIVKIKKPLLTEKEKEFLRNFDNIKTVMRFESWDYDVLIIDFNVAGRNKEEDINELGIPIPSIKHCDFKSLTSGREYTPEELGL